MPDQSADESTLDIDAAIDRLLTTICSDVDGNCPATIALSGGCDSSLLAHAFARAGVETYGVMVTTAFQNPADTKEAAEVARCAGIRFTNIPVDILSHDEICENTSERCYWCKRLIFGTIIFHMQEKGRDLLFDGTNASDDLAHRPGARTLSELQVLSPLREAGLTKPMVRAIARRWNLPFADKQSFSCYAIDVPQDTRITEDALREVRTRHEQ
jgi:uncharacterized protein